MANNDSNNSFVTHQERQPRSSSTPSWQLDTVRTPPTRERTPLQSSFDSLHGELSKLSAAVSQFAVVMGLQTTETLVTSSSPAAANSSVNSFHSRSDAAVSAYVAPEVFDTMPTPSSGCSKVFGKQPSAAESSSASSLSFPVGASSAVSTQTFASVSAMSASTRPSTTAYVAQQAISWQGTDVTAPNYFYGHHDPVHSTFVCNLSEQNLDGRPEANGLHNLNCKSVVPEPIFAVYDESDSSSIESVPLFERLPMFDVYDEESDSCSNESAHVFATTPEQHTYEEVQQEGEQEPKCMSKPSEFTLSDNDDVYGATYIKFRHGQCIREISRLHFSPGCALGDEANKWNMLLTEVRRKEWDPGILNQMDMTLVFSATGMEGPKNHLANQELRGMMLDKYAMSHESQFIHWSAEFLVLSSTACMQYVPPNGMYSVLHATCFLLQSAARLSQGNCLCSLYCNSVLNTEYCTERMQWDPGVTVSLYCWLDTLTVWSEIVTPFFCTHILELATCLNQVITASYVWDPGTMLLQHKSILLPNGSDLRDGQLAHMPQSPTINSSEFRRHMFTELSRWLSSFKNRVKLQWDPGIAFVYQQDVLKIYNTKNLLSSQNYLQILEIDIIFITFLPP